MGLGDEGRVGYGKLDEERSVIRFVSIDSEYIAIKWPRFESSKFMTDVSMSSEPLGSTP